MTCRCWRRFEDFWWYRNHSLFEEHASQKKALVSTPYRVLLIRLFCLLAMALNFTSSAVSGHVKIINVRFLTRWGVWFTNTVIVLGMIHTPYKKVRQFDEQSINQMYNPFALWKWYITIYQFVLTAEVIITVVFWTTLWPFMKNSPDHKGHSWAMMGLVTDHSFPLFILLIDFTTVSTIPFCKRHLIAIFPIQTAYLLTNLTY